MSAMGFSMTESLAIVATQRILDVSINRNMHLTTYDVCERLRMVVV